jgi:subtilisin family serine protease
MSDVLATPWAPHAHRYCAPGSLVFKLALGEAPDHVPAKVDVRARAQPPATRIDGGVVDRLIRHYTDGAHLTRVFASAASVAKRGDRHLGFTDVEHVLGFSRTFRLDTDRSSPVGDLAAALSEVPAVEYACPQYLCVVPFGESPAPTSAAPDAEEALAPRRQIHAQEALALEAGDPSVIVGILDSGVAAVHPELEGRLRPGFDTVQLGTGDFAAGVELLGDRAHVDTRPIDRYVGHGMACAGIIGANGRQIPAGLAGLSPILPLRVLGAARFPGKPRALGIGSISDIDCGMKVCVDLGARVLNLSFGTPDAALSATDPKPHAEVVQYALRRGCVLVAASGNSGREERFWPAAYDGVIAVGSVGPDGRHSAFTTFGDHVDLCAPGERIATLGLLGYQSASGTSFAAPFVTAVAALLVARASARSLPVDGMLVKQLLVDSCTPWPVPGTAKFGAGVLDAYAALRRLDEQIDASTFEQTESEE